MNESECAKQKGAAEDLADEIEEALATEDLYNSTELNDLRKLQKEAEALEQFIGSIGDCGTYIPSIEQFKMANQRVGANIKYIIKEKYCVDVVLVQFNNYVCYIAENNTSKNYKVSYKWKSKNGMQTGHGTMGLSKSSIRHMYDNREKTDQKTITVYNINCTEF